jgi:hypothetical protein
MKICYEIEGDFSFNGKQWCLAKYKVADPSHLANPPSGEIKTSFSKGDLIDLAFPIKNMEKHMYTDVYALVEENNPSKGWMISTYYDSTGIDFGTGYRVIYEVMIEGAEIALDEFRIAFVYSGNDRPGNQPWGFKTAGDPGQHTELGETYLCSQIESPNNLRTS